MKFFFKNKKRLQNSCITTAASETKLITKIVTRLLS